MGTKNNPGAFDCYANAEPDEPMFILLGRDVDAPGLVDLWARIREDNGEDPAKVLEARDCAAAMRNYLVGLRKQQRAVLEGLHIWAFEMSHGMTLSTFYIQTESRDIVDAAATAEAIRNDPDRFIADECSIRNLVYCGDLNDVV